jgi:hypothetical protein
MTRVTGWLAPDVWKEDGAFETSVTITQWRDVVLQNSWVLNHIAVTTFVTRLWQVRNLFGVVKDTVANATTTNTTTTTTTTQVQMFG